MAIRSINNIELTGLTPSATNFAFLALSTGFTSCIQAYDTGIYRAHLTNVANPQLAGVQINVTSVYRVCVSTTSDVAAEYKDQGFTLSAGKLFNPLVLLFERRMRVCVGFHFRRKREREET